MVEASGRNTSPPQGLGEYGTEKQAAARYGVNPSFFSKRRLKTQNARPDGVPYMRVGRRIVYHFPTLDEFFAKRGSGI